MFKNKIVQTLINLEKNGVLIFLTEDGWKEFINLLMQENYIINQQEKAI